VRSGATATAFKVASRGRSASRRTRYKGRRTASARRFDTRSSPSSAGYEAVGVGYALLGIAFLAYGFHRQRHQEAGLLEGRFVPFAPGAALVFALAGIALGIATVIAVVA